MLVLRDVEEDEHLEALDKAARANLEALWRDVDKPSRCEVDPNALSPLAAHLACATVGGPQQCPHAPASFTGTIPGARHCIFQRMRQVGFCIRVTRPHRRYYTEQWHQCSTGTI